MVNNKMIPVGVFDEIINGTMNPNLPKFDDRKKLDSLVQMLHKNEKYNFSSNAEYKSFITLFDWRLFGFDSSDDYKIHLNKKPNDGVELTFIPTKVYSCNVMDYQPMEFKSYKVQKYVELFNDCFRRIRIITNCFNETETNEDKLKNFARRNMQTALRIFKDSIVMLAKSINEKKCEVSQILFVQSDFIINTILFFKEQFSVYLDNLDKINPENLYKKIYMIISNNYRRLINNNLILQTCNSYLEIQIEDDPIKKKSHFSLQTNLDKNNEMETSLLKLKWNGQINVLVDLFLQLSELRTIENLPYLEYNSNQLKTFLLDNFVDKQDSDLSHHTLRTLLDPKRFDKRIKADSPKRLILNGFMDNSGPIDN